MRKLMISVLMIPFLLFAGCGEREAKLENGFFSFREEVTLATQITAVAELTADYGGTSAEYTLQVVYDGQRTAITVVEPELIAGVTAVAEKGETSVSFDNVILGAGALNEEGITPVSAIPCMLDAMASGYQELLWWEGDCITARLFVGDLSVMTLWIEPETLVPVCAEIATEGRTVITCRFTQWSIT